MPYIDYQTYPLWIELPDYVMINITIKQKALVINQTWDIQTQQVRLAFDIIPFEKLPDNSYGQRLDTIQNSMFYARNVTIVAKNGDFLDVDNNGAVLCHTDEEYIDGDLNPILEGKNYMKDYNYYHQIAFNTPIIIAELITFAVLGAPGQAAPIEPPPAPSPMQYVWVGQVAPPLLSGFASMQNDDQANPGNLYFNTMSSDFTTDNTAEFAAIVSGSVIRIEQDSSKWQEYMAVAPAEIGSGSVTVMGSVHWNAGQPIEVNQPVSVIITPPA
jgi:hypothetical protein